MLKTKSLNKPKLYEFVTKLTRLVTLVEQELLFLPEHMSSTPDL